MKSTILATSAFFVLCLSSRAEFVDKLKPPFVTSREKEMREVIAHMASTSCEVQVIGEPKAIRTNYSFSRPEYKPGYEYRCIPSADDRMRAQAVTHDIVLGGIEAYLLDKRYSYGAALFLFAQLPSNVTMRAFYRFESLEKKDKTLWDGSLSKNAMHLMETLSVQNRYAGIRFYESVPTNFHDRLFTARIRDIVKLKYMYSPLASKEYVNFKSAMTAFNEGSSTNASSVIPIDVKHLENWWAHLLKSDSQNERPEENLPAFIFWSRLYAKDHPELSAAMMGLFVVYGYQFDNEKGSYQLTDRGRGILDYIVEFPIPENATRIKILMDGGNREMVDGLMQKHKTEKTWQELLKNSVEPELIAFK